jgi:hypothetical protein
MFIPFLVFMDKSAKNANVRHLCSFLILALTMREERRLRVFENRVSRRIFGPKRVTGKWRKLHNEELNALYCSPNIV